MRVKKRFWKRVEAHRKVLAYKESLKARYHELRAKYEAYKLSEKGMSNA